MPKKIDWLYFRKACNTCKKAGAFLSKGNVEIRETVDAVKNRYDSTAALGLTAGIDRIVAARGAKIDVLSLKDEPGDDAVLALIMGPTGNLRAPTARVGRTLLVGFNDEAYGEVLGVK